MKNENSDIELLDPKEQLVLYGYDEYFNNFANLFDSKKLPNSLLISGAKGIGKSTFIYHFINFLLSKNEKNKYSIEKKSIDENNISYKHLINGTHPNFFLVDKKVGEKEIKIEQIRNLLTFVNKTTLSNNLKLVLVDNVEDLNINASNALLKALEEPKNDTFFFLIHNNAARLIKTIKSRCIEFKFFMTLEKNKSVFKKLVNQYKIDVDTLNDRNNFLYDSPVNLIKHSFADNKDLLNIILNRINNFKTDKKSNELDFLLNLIEQYYNQLVTQNNGILNLYFYNYRKILKTFNDIKKYNLNEKSNLINIKEILINEKK
jgi:DNA polymerase III subunit delta'